MTPNEVKTVTGGITVEDLGTTLIHEHVLVDMRPAYRSAPGLDPDAVPDLHEIGRARRDFTRFPGVIVLDDVTTAVEELAPAVAAGCRTVVDQTTIGLRLAADHALKLRDVARETGLNIILGTGYYIHTSHPEFVQTSRPEAIADKLVAELVDGIDGTGIRAGAIGEIGMSQPIHQDEWKVLEAACIAQVQTGVPLLIHPHYGGNSRVAPDIGRFIVDHGVDPGRVCMGHMDGYMDLDYQRAIADMGFYVAFDGFGLELYYDQDSFNHNTHDSLRMRHLLQLLDQGYAKSLLLSHDVATKLQLRKMGGWGYAHLFENIAPALRFHGLDYQTWETMTVENPKNLFAR